MFLIFQFLKYHFLALEVRIDVSVNVIWSVYKNVYSLYFNTSINIFTMAVRTCGLKYSKWFNWGEVSNKVKQRNLKRKRHGNKARQIFGQVESSENSEFFPEICNSEFSILAIGQNRKLGNKKTRNNISEISEVSEFSIWHFLIFQKTFFFSVFYSRQFRNFYLCFEVFFPSPKIYVQNITLS